MGTGKIKGHVSSGDGQVHPGIGRKLVYSGSTEQRGQTETYRGHEFSVSLVRKVQLMIAVNDNFLQPTIDAIIKGGRTGAAGEVGDGKIFVLPLEDCIRIRTGERGGEAI